MKFSETLTRKFQHEPTPSQRMLFEEFDTFFEQQKGRPVFLMKGFAGTGKTSVISALVKALPTINYRSVLMAPTGRAAKVMASYSKRRAFTIHKLIYRLEEDKKTGELRFKLQKNNATKTVFIVDEASMLSDESGGAGNSLLQDLVEFVYASSSNRLLLVGDTAQLPPVNQSESPALDADSLEWQFRLHVYGSELTHVVRQEEGTGILDNATHLREKLTAREDQFALRTRGYKDIFRMTSDRLEDGLRYAYDKFGTENTVIICRSNKSAVNFNQYIRRQIHFFEEELEAGDMLMIVRNNYTCLPPDSGPGFLANGDFVEVRKIIDFEDRYGFRFAKLRLHLVDYPEQEDFDTWVVLNTLYSSSPALTQEEYRKLFLEVREEYKSIGSKKKLRKALDEDPFLNALQVKFAYALTCHKSQGGQWPAVFVDQGFLSPEMMGRGFLRWLYTAVTRSTQELFLVNFETKFFE
ncbi:MAG: AAA family ATPase [Cytophagales bacterium]|nr:AAA family ATPase [Cytophagales bacterium]